MFFLIITVMSKSIYVCSRLEHPNPVRYRLEEICSRLAPENIKSARPEVLVNGDIAFGIINPVKSIVVKGKSLLLGTLFEDTEQWDIPGSSFPDGTYALFRENEGYVEVVTDPAASRTIWYYFDEDQFVASTSQRAIIMYLKSFSFDDRVIPWMLSTGTLGPFSWDKRIRRVQNDSSVLLDRKKWSISLKSNPIEFIPVNRTEDEYEELLKEILREVTGGLRPDYSSWVVPLSGGYDSRAIICLLLESSVGKERPTTITWGTRAALNVRGNDACVAAGLAKALNVENRYFVYEESDASIEEIIGRFISSGEGRIDDLSDYMDGFATWESISEAGIEGIIRGDESFGWHPVTSEQSVRLNVECGLCTDYSNLKDYEKLAIPHQEVPDYLRRKEKETLSTWRDRIFIEYMQPVVQAALTDLKLAFVEQINPLLSGRVLKIVRQMPDQLRDGRTLFKKLVRSISPDFEFATSPSSLSRCKILKQEKVTGMLKQELSGSDVRSLFSKEFLLHVLQDIKEVNQRESQEQIASDNFSVKKMVPSFVKQAVRTTFALPRLDGNLLAFRVMMINRMNLLLCGDSR